MCAALEYVRTSWRPWCASHPGSFPPVVIHLTDGEATDGDPEPAAEALKGLVHRRRRAAAVQLPHLGVPGAARWSSPTSELMLPDELAKVAVPDVERAARDAARRRRSRRACSSASERGAWCSTPTPRRCSSSSRWEPSERSRPRPRSHRHQLHRSTIDRLIASRFLKPQAVISGP